MGDQQKLQTLSDEYQKLQEDLTELIRSRQKLEAQYTENQTVQKEFASLDDEANVYRQVGPVLLKQDTAEAKSTVDSRLGYIDGEIKRVEQSIKSSQEKSEGKKMEIIRIQTQMQQGQAAAAA